MNALQICVICGISVEKIFGVKILTQISLISQISILILLCSA